MHKSIKEMFPDWKEIGYEKWSSYGKVLHYKDDLFRNCCLEIGLYKEYDGSYTLQIFDNDNVIFCETVG